MVKAQLRMKLRHLMGKYADACSRRPRPVLAERPSATAAGRRLWHRRGGQLHARRRHARPLLRQAAGLPIDRYRISQGRVPNRQMTVSGIWRIRDAPAERSWLARHGRRADVWPDRWAGPGVVTSALTAPALLSGPLGRCGTLAPRLPPVLVGSTCCEAVGNALSR